MNHIRYLCVFTLIATSRLAIADLQITPPAVKLTGKDARQLILVTGTQGARKIDLSREAKFSSSPAGVVKIEDGIIQPLKDGAATITIEAGGKTASLSVDVKNAHTDSPVDFERDIIPIFSRFGCNAGACHGKARGQNGFQLSLLGFDSNFDYDALVKEARGRRVSSSSPESSLLLLKPTGGLPHGGGRLLQPDGHEYHTMLR